MYCRVLHQKKNVKKQRKNTCGQLVGFSATATQWQPKPPYCPTVAAVKGHSPPILGGVPKNCEEYRESPLKPKVPVSGEHPPVAGARQGEATTVRCNIHFTAQEGIQMVEKASHQMHGRCHSWAMPTPSQRIFPAALGGRCGSLSAKFRNQ